MQEANIRKAVREGYAQIAKGSESSCCASANSSCCGGAGTIDDISKNIGYTAEELASIPKGADLGLGCGNPLAHASLKKGEVVLDLGSGAGIDCFLAANSVGPTGKVIGVDMTPEMIEKARENARKGGYKNVEFRLGEIENLPVADNSVDIIISNCVINLSPDKDRVFAESFRALKPGGRLMVSDLVLLKELPEFIKNSVRAYIGCLSGALMKDTYLDAIRKAGLKDVRVIEEIIFPIDYMLNDLSAFSLVKESGKSIQELSKGISDTIASVKVYAIKP